MPRESDPEDKEAGSGMEAEGQCRDASELGLEGCHGTAE